MLLEELLPGYVELGVVVKLVDKNVDDGIDVDETLPVSEVVSDVDEMYVPVVVKVVEFVDSVFGVLVVVFVVIDDVLEKLAFVVMLRENVVTVVVSNGDLIEELDDVLVGFVVDIVVDAVTVVVSTDLIEELDEVLVGLEAVVVVDVVTVVVLKGDLIEELDEVLVGLVAVVVVVEFNFGNVVVDGINMHPVPLPEGE